MENFMIEITRNLTDKVGDEFQIIKENLIKVNDQRRKAVILKRREDEVSRCVYLERYFQMYKSGCSVDEITDYIIQDTLDDRKYANLKEKISVNDIKLYEKVKNKLVVRFLNAEMNKRYLADKVYVPYLDLATVICILWDDIDGELASSAVSKKLLSYWNVTIEEVYEQALMNMKTKLPENVHDIRSIMISMYEKAKGALSLEDYELLQSDDINVFYVLTNNTAINGAATILYEGVLWNFADEHKVEEVIIFPASVHEMLLIPRTENWNFTVEQCRDMVRDVNYKEVDYAEILSNNVYIYNKTTDEVRIWSE